MNHETLQDLVFKLRDGEATVDETASAQAHLQACADCRRDLDLWERTSTALFARTAPAPSEAFVRRVMEGLDRPGWWESFLARARIWASPLPLRWVAAGAIAAALALVVPPAFKKPELPVATASSGEWVAELAYAPDDSVDEVGSEIEAYFL